MKIRKIELRNFRNYDHLELIPDDGINLFYGRNGSGKTNLLEAIHYCALGKSHRLSQDLNAVRIGETFASCEVRVESRFARSDIQVRLQPGEEGKKTVFVDHARIRRFSELMGRLRCVLFSPEDLSMIRGGPSLRRRFMDMMISQVSPAYFIALQQYRTALDQRNAILKNSRISGARPDPMIEDFERAMVENALPIFRERVRMTDMLSGQAPETYRRISGQKEDFRLSYRSPLLHADNPEASLLETLRQSREEDQRTGQTSGGPHRDDLVMTLNQKDMKLFASQGQVRTAALSLRLSQLRVLERNAQDTPILLLDDVMSELDQVRRMNLLEEIGDTQTFITFSDETDLAENQAFRTCEVTVEEGCARIAEKKPGLLREEAAWQEPDFC